MTLVLSRNGFMDPEGHALVSAFPPRLEPAQEPPSRGADPFSTTRTDFFKRKLLEDDEDPLFNLWTYCHTAVPVLEERSLVLRLSLEKVRFLDDPEAFLRRSVLVNNLLRRLLQSAVPHVLPSPTGVSIGPDRRSGRGFGLHSCPAHTCCCLYAAGRFLLPPPSAYGAEEEEEEPRDEGCAAADTVRRLNRTETLPGQRDTRTEEEEEEEEADGPAGVHRFSFWPHRTHRQLPSLSPWQQGPSGRTFSPSRSGSTTPTRSLGNRLGSDVAFNNRPDAPGCSATVWRNAATCGFYVVLLLCGQTRSCFQTFMSIRTFGQSLTGSQKVGLSPTRFWF
ncbi:uncharacterized protein sertad4 [Xiphophorus hellerii]|uniref:uncharacterized protein sertad4 n=1 Tax=Xiphophorus hellerii TaxID=8084 RepID=UPI0013B3E3DD|nr:SERTA domain-containing protein 4 [Xiphophorus hellerii]